MKFSKLTLGTVQFGLNYGIANRGGKPSYENSRDIVKIAYENGITTFDTAAAYGDSEKILGKIFTELNIKDKIQVISKVPPLNNNLSKKEIEKSITKSVEDSLKHLGIEQLSGSLFHLEDDIEYIDMLQKLESRGLIAGSGVSLDSLKYCDKIIDNGTQPLSQTAQNICNSKNTTIGRDNRRSKLACNRRSTSKGWAIKPTYGIKFIQLPYNILDKRFDSFLKNCKKTGIKIFTRSLYLQGLLLMPESNIIPHLKSVIPIRRKLEQLSQDAGMDMAELCMRYVLSNSTITSILTGVDSKKQLEENIKLFNKEHLPNDLLNEIKNIIPIFPEKVIRPIFWPK